MSDDLDGPIRDAALNPRWRVVNLTFDEARMIALEIEHPRAGRMAFLIPRSEVEAMIRGLQAALDV
jgi:hypothetical protein